MKTPRGNRKQAAPMRGIATRGGVIVVEILLLGSMAGLAGLVALWRWETAAVVKSELARLQLAEFLEALRRYQFDVGAFPGEAVGIAALIENPGTDAWRGPYLNARRLPGDPWGGEYWYLEPVEGRGWYNVFSAGPDRRFGTVDDVGARLKAPRESPPAAAVLLVRGSRCPAAAAAAISEVCEHETSC